MSSALRPARSWMALVASIALVLALFPVVPEAAADDPLAPDVVISQVYGGGGNSGALYTHDFVELFNRGGHAQLLDGWSVQYASASGSTWNVTPLSGTIEPGQRYLIQQAAGAGGTTPLPTPDATGTANMASGAGKVALVASTTSVTGTCPDGVVDGVGYGTSASCWQLVATLTNTSAGLRDGDRCGDTFSVVTPPQPENTSALAAPCGEVAPPGDPVPVVTCPTGVRTVESYATDGPVSATMEDGEIVDLAVTSVTPAPAAGELQLDDVTTGPAASATLVVPEDLELSTPSSAADVRPLSVQITATADDGSTGTCTASVAVVPLVPIGAVQGTIADDATSFTSPLLGAEVAVKAVVTQHTMEGNGNRGFFVQNRPDEADGDPRSSDGIFVFNGSFTTLRTDVDGPARPSVGGNWTVATGDEVVLRGTVAQYFGNTQLAGSSTFVWDVTGTDLDPLAEVLVTEVDPPDDAGDALRYLRRHLGMQLEVPAGSQVVGGRDVFGGTDAEVWAIRGDHEVAQRDDPYHRRVFRDAHPLDNRPETAFDDGNGYRFVLGSFGLKATTGDADTVLAPARTFDTIENSTVGGVYLSFGKYTINVADQLQLAQGVDPAANDPVVAADRDREHAIAAYNVENLYDTRDNPNSGCDTPDGPGCPGVSPPFDYLPGTEEEYQERLVRMAQQIVEDLHSPDVLMIQETEAQDVCSVSAAWTPDWDRATGEDRLDCDLVNAGDLNTRADGAPDSLQELALVIEEEGGPAYAATFDLAGGDARGITTAYLYRTDRVELPAAAEDDPVLAADVDLGGRYDLTDHSRVTANPKSLNAAIPDDVRCAGGAFQCVGDVIHPRAPMVASFRVWRAGIGTSTFRDLYLVNNHQSAGPQNRVSQRREQVAFNAAIAETILDADPSARVLIGGDFNVFPRPDDPYAPGETIGHGELGPSDQMAALYDSPMVNLHGLMLERSPSTTYTFGFQGQAQTLDQLWVSPALLDDVLDVSSAKINVDWPADARGEEPAYGRFGVSDHDPESGTFDLAVTFTSMRALVDWLLAEGELPADLAASIHDRLTNAERFVEAGNDRAAGSQLDSIDASLRGAAREGDVAGPVADGLRAEVAMLREVDTASG